MKADIILHYRDELRATIESNAGISFEIAEEFAFYVNGYKFMPQYKSGRWDGRIRLYDVKTRGFYIGLIPRLMEWAERSGYTIAYANEDEFFKNKMVAAPEELDDVLGRVGKFEPKWYQRKAIECAFEKGKVLILSPTGSGKSYIMYLTIRFLAEHYPEVRTLITVPSKSLVEQLYSDFNDYSIDGWNVEENVHRLYGGKEKETKHQVVVSTWQTAWKMPKPWFKQFGAYICDEAHGADGKCISLIVDNLSHAALRIGLTGTLDGTSMHVLDMEARFGEIVRVASTKQLMDDGDLTDLDIDCIHLKYPKEDIDIVKHLEYQKEIDFLISHPRRNKFMAKVALTQTGNTLMLFNYIQKHGEELKKILEPLCEKYGKKLYYIHGQTDVEDREHIRQILETENKVIGYELKVGEFNLKIRNGEEVKLSDGTFKPIENVNTGDDIDDRWLHENRDTFKDLSRKTR